MNLAQAEHYGGYPGTIDPGFDEPECCCGAENPEDCICEAHYPDTLEEAGLAELEDDDE